MTSTADPQARDRLGPWIDAVRRRIDHVRPAHAAEATRLLVGQLTALASGDVDRLATSLAPDVAVNVWGGVPGGRWSWNGATAREALVAFLADAPVDVRSARVDIDRLFPGGDVVGFDGDLSWLAAGATLAARSAFLDASATYLVQRRVAVFASYRGGRLSELDVYVDVHEARDVSDRSGH